MNAIRNILPPDNSQIYTPSKSATVAASGTETLIFQGLGRNEFGFDRILIGCTNPEKVKVTAKLNNDFIVFENVQVQAINRLFEFVELVFPFIIKNNNRLVLTLTNTDTVNAHDVNVQLLGFDEPHLNKLRAAYEENGIIPPEPVFIVVSDSIPADTERKRLQIELRSEPTKFWRMIVSSDGDPDLRVSFASLNDELKSDLFVSQINTEFNVRRSRVPFMLNAHTPAYLYVTNKNLSNARDFCFLAEAYIDRNSKK